MCWNKSDPSPWAPWMKISSVFLPPSVVLTHYCLFQGTALPSVHGNANVTLLPLTWCPQLLIPSIHPLATPASWLFFYCIPFFSSLCLSRFYKMLSFPPFKVLLTPLLWLSIASSLFNPLCSPMFETILSKKKVNLVIVAHLQLLNSPSLLLCCRPNSLLRPSSSEPSVHRQPCALLSFTLCLLVALGFFFQVVLLSS